MKYWILSLLLSMCSLNAVGYSLSISGEARGLNSRTVHLGCSSWIEDQVVVLDASGKFSFYVSEDNPAMYSLTYGEGMDKLVAEVFVFEDVEVKAELIAEPGNERVFMFVPQLRNLAFKKAKEYVDQLYVRKPTDNYTLDNIVKDIINERNIGRDNYSNFFAISEKLNYIQTMQTSYGKKINLDVFTSLEFQELPLNDARFMGFQGYKELMVANATYEIRENLISNNKSLYSFSDWMWSINANSEGMPSLIRFEMIKNLLLKQQYETLPEHERVYYKEELLNITNNYPNNIETQELWNSLYDILGNLEDQIAPAFALLSPENHLVTLDQYRGKYLLIDVWGSWCKPCRANNPKLVEFYDKCKANGMNIEFLSIAKETSTAMWKRAIEKDGLKWDQALADPTFLENYKVDQFPTMILIDEGGVVKRISSKIGMEELMYHMYTISD